MAITKNSNRQMPLYAYVDINMTDLTSDTASDVVMDLPPQLCRHLWPAGHH